MNYALIKTVLLRVAMVTLGILIAFGIAELLSRWYFYRWNHNESVPFLLFGRAFPEADSQRGLIQTSKLAGIPYEFKSNIRTVFLDRTFVTNSAGMVGEKEFSPEKPPHTIRIAGIGDSFMTSWGILPSETCMAGIEQKLREALAPVNVEVMNFGVVGYNTAIEYEVIRQKALVYHPDLIVLQFCPNDMDTPNFLRRKVVAKSYAVYVMELAIKTIEYANRTDEEAAQEESLWGMKNVFVRDLQPNGTMFLTRPEEAPAEYRYMIGENNYLISMKKIADLSKSENIPVIVMESPERFDSKFQDWGLETPKIYTQLLSDLRKNGLPTTLVTRNKDDWHFNSKGHAYCTEHLSEYLLNESPAFKKILNEIQAKN